MALNNRIYKYKCDICRRSIERLADPTRPDPLRCVITDQCSGKLSLAGSRFGLRPENTPTVIGLLDRIKRGAPRTTLNASKPLDVVSLSTGAGSLTLALLQSVVVGAERRFYVNSNGIRKVLKRTSLSALLPSDVTITAVLFELTPAALEYKRYTYVRAERCVFVEGKDDSASQNVLAFDSSTNVRVLVNGMLLRPSLYTKTDQSTIIFTPELEEPSLLIEVFVYKSLTQFFSEDQAIRLSFRTLSQYDDARSAYAWGDAAKAGQFSPMYCTDISALDRSRTYGLVRFEAVDETLTTVTADPQGSFLLALAPHSFQDKRLTAIVPLTALTSEGFSLSFSIDDETGDSNLVVDGEALQPLTRQLTTTTLSAVIEAKATELVSLVIPRKEKAFIIGPT